MNDIKEIVYDFSIKKNKYIYYTDEEQIKVNKFKEEINSIRPLTLSEKVELLEKENADLLFDSAIKDLKIDFLEKDLADLTFEIAIGGM